MHNQIKDLTGRTFGRLTVIGLSHVDNGKAYWKCHCKCDEHKPIEERKVHIKKAKYLLAGQTNSCGCLRAENLAKSRSKTRSHSKKEEYSKPFYKELRNNWNTLKNRCHNKSFYKFSDYGAKGIYVCDEWRDDFWSFYNWAIENGYKKGYTLDRLGNNYNPDSCEWTDKSTNCSTTKNGTQISIRNKTQTAASWERDPECEVTASTILQRYKNGIRGTKLLKKRVQMKDKVIEINGEIKTFAEWAAFAGISLNAFVTRWRRGKKGKALIEPGRYKQ